MATPETQPAPVSATWAETFTGSPGKVDPIGGCGGFFATSTSPPSRGVFSFSDINNPDVPLTPGGLGFNTTENAITGHWAEDHGS